MDEPIPMEVFEDAEEVTDLEELQFPQQIISDIIKKRKENESKLMSPSVEHYMEYIATEKRLLALIRCKDKFPEKKKIMEARLVKKIDFLYKEARNKFEKDYQLMLDYFRFLKEIKAKIRAKEIIEILLANHAEKEEAWLTAITYYIQSRNPESVIYQTICKALIHHPSSTDIFLKIFNFYLEIIKNSSDRKETEGYLEKLKEFIDLFFQNIKKDIEQYFDIRDKFAEVNEAKQYFFMKIMKVYKGEPLFWKIWADRESKGSPSTQGMDSIYGGSLTPRIAIYEKGLTYLPENKKSDLWSVYLKECSAVKITTTNDLKFVNEKFEVAHNGRYVTEDQYFSWIELNKRTTSFGMLTNPYESMQYLARNHSMNREVFEKALDVYPQSIRLWKAYLKFIINTDNPIFSDIRTIFERAVAALGKDSLDIWLMFLSYCEQLEQHDYIKNLYLQAMEDPQIAVAVVVKYIRWLYVNCGVEKCRNAYDLFMRKKLPSKNVHRAMLKLEYLEFTDDYQNWEKVYTNFLDQFPQDIDVWRDYIQFHKKYKKSNEEIIRTLYERRLPESLHLQLRERLSRDAVDG